MILTGVKIGDEFDCSPRTVVLTTAWQTDRQTYRLTDGYRGALAHQVKTNKMKIVLMIRDHINQRKEERFTLCIKLHMSQ